MTDPDVVELARTLKAAIAGHERLVVTEAQKRAAKLAKEYAKAADERIKDNAADMQRLEDLVREFKRQRAPLERAADKYAQIVTAVRRAGYAGEGTITVAALLDIINAPATTNSVNPNGNPS